ncbi:GntR family transcriptional regulator [Salinarimonas ramus]|uniref:GntR family transcriptional regulator n=1 Tax=Salinarimonas ramus TaxID=690164 RepID=A0A917QAQ0_9HYPH|nr:GntR family transcriptional regulator [Salinarimonas ramus]GGK39643.1 GntR family transcriptional regulator [Salinarimonas ramus]
MSGRVRFEIDDRQEGPRHRPRPLGQRTIGQRVFEVLKAAIVQLDLRPGDSLSEAEIAKELGVSRQPVREAFIKLAEAGLVEVRPQRGTFVVLISQREVENARFLREAIEVAIVRKAAQTASSEALADLRDILERQRDARAAADAAHFLRLDETFHYALAVAADCTHAWRVLETLKAQMDRVRFLSLPDATPVDVLIAQHQAILDAVAAGSPGDAEAAMRAHLAEILVSLPRLAADKPELFEPVASEKAAAGASEPRLRL